MSSVSKGNTYKAKTKKWLEALGYDVAHLERMHFIFGKSGRFPIKRDQFGCDLLAINESRVIFIQVKRNDPGKAAAIRAFAAFRFPDQIGVSIWLITWRLRAREPEIADVTAEVLNARRSRQAGPA